MATTIRRTVAIVAFAALVAGAFSISCYTTGAVVTNSGSNSVTWPQTPDLPVGSHTSCLSYSVAGSASYNGITVSASGKDGEGSACTCAQWASTTGCNGVTQAQATTIVQTTWTAAFRTLSSNGAATVSNAACCSTDNCNDGLSIRVSSAALPMVNMLTLLATALVGYVFTSKLV